MTSFLTYDGKTLSIVSFDGRATFAMPAATLPEAERAVLALANGLFHDIQQGGQEPDTGAFSPICVAARTMPQDDLAHMLAVIGAETYSDPERDEPAETVGLHLKAIRRQLAAIGRQLGFDPANRIGIELAPTAAARA